jgi:hypothetical protein
MADTIQIKPAFYWDLNDFSPTIRGELNRRGKISGDNFTYSPGISVGSQYTHPLSPWVRVCSNSAANDKNGFILGGMTTSGFKTTYGFLKDSNGRVIGYSATGEPHSISNEKYTHRPAPGIMSIETELSGGDGKFRITTIKWVCWSLDQLHYMTPYFLTAGVSMSVEFGWNNFDGASLLPLSNSNELLKYFYNDSDVNIRSLVNKSLGNYDGSIGIVSDFEYNFRSDGGFDCTTVVKNIGGFYSGVYSSGRSSPQTSDPESTTKEFRTFMKSSFNAISSLAKKKHTGDPYKANGVYVNRVSKVGGNAISKQVFYGRDGNNFDRLTSQGRPKDYDFDNTSDNWWMSFGYLIEVLNKKCAIKTGSRELFNIDISNTVINAHPNLTTNNGNVLLIPSTILPQFRITSNEDTIISEQIRMNDSGNPDLVKANEILKSKIKNFSNSGGAPISISRVNANNIINWWSDNAGPLSFPACAADDRIKKPYTSGYLKNLYVSKKTIIDAVDANNTFRDTLTAILEQMSKAAGDYWHFEIVPLDPDGNDNSTLTIIDKNCSNSFNPINLYDFKINEVSSIVKAVSFNVKNSNAMSVQTLMTNGKKDTKNPTVSKVVSTDGGIRQEHTISLTGLLRNDRLIKNVEPIEEKLEAESIQKVDPSAKLKLINKRIPAKESAEYFFYTKNDKLTYLLAEPEDELQKGLLHEEGKPDPSIYSSVQPGISLELTIQGISGMVNLNCFTVSELPSPYGDKCYFQVENVKHVVSNGNWETKITAGVRLIPDNSPQ